jgi:valyl-tRNA synthetase
VTEALWGHLKNACQETSPALAPERRVGGRTDHRRLARTEPMEGWEAEAIDNFALIQEMVRAIRNIRSEYKVEPQRRIPAQSALALSSR